MARTCLINCILNGLQILFIYWTLIARTCLISCILNGLQIVFIYLLDAYGVDLFD